jgi:phosphoglycolate phosphatase
MPPPIVVFDLDNTLVHSRIDFAGIRRVVVAALVEAGALVEPPSDPRVRAIPEWLALAEAHDSALGERLWREVDAFERDGMVHGSVEADVLPTLRALRADGARLALLTNNSLASAEAALARFDLAGPFERVFARGVVAALKPAGDGVARAHAELGGGPIAVVGDSYIDGLAAQRAGVGARFVAFRASAADLAAHGVTPWATITALGELPATGVLGPGPWLPASEPEQAGPACSGRRG